MKSFFHPIAFLAIFSNFLCHAWAFNNFPSIKRPEPHIPPPGADVGDALFLTPLIEAGQLDEARNLSKVGPLEGTSIESYSGYFTVNPEYNSNLFFWYFPALNNPETAPVALWLQGGPGSSSLFGLFVENGPFYVTKEIKLAEREYSWGRDFHLFYIDNPVGTGYSFTESDDGYPNNETEVARDLYEALQQFFTLFSELQTHDFYLTGESYAGKYVPAIGYKIFTENPTAQLKINLKGLAIGDGLIDAETQYNYGDYFYNVGLIDEAQKALFVEQENLMIENIQAGDYMDALYNFDTLVNGGFVVHTSFYRNFTGLFDTYNYLLTFGPIDQNYYSLYVVSPSVRKAIHVGNLTYNNGATSQDHLLGDITQSTKSWVETLLDNDYRVLLYSGQVDVIIPYLISLNLINNLNWKYAEDYQIQERVIWKVDENDQEIAGYVKQSHNFYEALVRDAGHMVPYDQSRVGFDLITRFIFNKPFD